jgi:hypothetical protein
MRRRSTLQGDEENQRRAESFERKLFKKRRNEKE